MAPFSPLDEVGPASSKGEPPVSQEAARAPPGGEVSAQGPLEGERGGEGGGLSPSSPGGLPFSLDERYLLSRWASEGQPGEDDTAAAHGFHGSFSSASHSQEALPHPHLAGLRDGGAVPKDVCESRITLKGFSGEGNCSDLLPA